MNRLLLFVFHFLVTTLMFSQAAEGEYILHVHSLPSDILEVYYSGDYTGIEYDSFTIGPFSEPFTVLLRPRLIQASVYLGEEGYANYSIRGWVTEEGDPVGPAINVDDFFPERTILLDYIISYGPEPTSEPKPSPPYTAPCMWLSPSEESMNMGSSFRTILYANTGGELFTSYQLDLYYNPDVLRPDTGQGPQGVRTGSDGFVSQVDVPQPGHMVMSGFDAQGTGPGERLEVADFNWIAYGSGYTALALVVPEPARGYDTAVTVGIPACGDANSDTMVDIIDALLVARYYVGLPPADALCGWTFGCPADVDGNAIIDIRDALFIAQYYVGLRTYLNCAGNSGYLE